MTEVYTDGARLLLSLAAVVALAGCGTVAGRSGAPDAPPGATLAAAPPLQVVDEAPDVELRHMLAAEFAPLPASFGQAGAAGSSSTGIVGFTWLNTWSSDGGSTSTTPTPDQLAQIRADFDARRLRIEPAPGSTPRVIARLPLAGGGDALLAVWHNRDGLLCTETQVEDAQGGGGGAVGPCASTDQGVTPCTPALCLSSSGSGSSLADERYVLSGTVAADADAIDVATADGATSEYPLAGPLVDGDRRVFMLELGPTDWRTLTLLRGGQVVGTVALPALSAASEDCMAKVGPLPVPTPSQPPATGPTQQTSEMQAWDESFQSCMRASGALPALPSAPPATPGP